jgi:hypothetical protein
MPPDTLQTQHRQNASRLLIASAKRQKLTGPTKQSSFGTKEDGLLRFARNDESQIA